MMSSEIVNKTTNRFGIKGGAEDFPLMVVVAVSYVCNAKCPACPYTQSEIRNSYRDVLFMSASTFMLIAGEVGRHKAFLRITGGGEPLLHSQMISLIEYAKSKEVKVGLITNGSLLTKPTVDRLLDAGTDAIEISADAADGETYIKVRKGLDFDKLVQNVEYLVSHRNLMSSGTKIIVSVIDQEVVHDKLDSIITFWKNIGVDNIQVRKYLTWGIGDSSKSGDQTPYMPVDEAVRTPCPFPFERLNIDSRGKIEFCGFDIAGETDFGNVNNVTIESVWKDNKFNQWRRLLLEGKYEEIEICKKCPDWKYRSWEHNYWQVLNKAETTRVDRMRQ